MTLKNKIIYFWNKPSTLKKIDVFYKQNEVAIEKLNYILDICNEQQGILKPFADKATEVIEKANICQNRIEQFVINLKENNYKMIPASAQAMQKEQESFSAAFTLLSKEFQILNGILVNSNSNKGENI